MAGQLSAMWQQPPTVSQVLLLIEKRAGNEQAASLYISFMF